jgi:hypothetical protein
MRMSAADACYWTLADHDVVDDLLESSRQTGLLDPAMHMSRQLCWDYADICDRHVELCLLHKRLEVARMYAELGIEYAAMAFTRGRPTRVAFGGLAADECRRLLHEALHGCRWLLEGGEDEALLRAALEFMLAEEARHPAGRRPRVETPILVRKAMLAMYVGEFETARRLLERRGLPDERSVEPVPVDCFRDAARFCWALAGALGELREQREFRRSVLESAARLLEVWRGGRMLDVCPDWVPGHVPNRDEALEIQLRSLHVDEAVRFAYILAKHTDRFKVEPFTRPGVIALVRG